jgi:membrane-associated PAP2 superfamily phosphatase
MSPAARFWWTHAVLPGAGLALALAVVSAFDLDRRIAHALYFDAVSGRWLGEANGAWWARDVVHTGGLWLVRLLATAVFATWLATIFLQRLRPWRRYAGFAVLAFAVSTGIVGVLKEITDVDCPRDLAEFGGKRPYVALFADRPDSLPHATCFPGAHSSGGFGLVFGYFLLLERSRDRRRWALAAAVLLGTAFSIAQEARGAHFLSHDLTSASIVWFSQLLVYVWFLQSRGVERSQRADVDRASTIEATCMPRLATRR